MNANALLETTTTTARTTRPSAEQHARTVWFRSAASDGARQRALLASLYRSHRSAVVAFARRLGATEIDAEDVCADVFVIALKRLTTFRGQSTPRTWLLGITRCVMSDRRRSAPQRREVLVDASPDGLAGCDAEAELMAHERSGSVRAAVAALPPAQRRVVTRYHLDEAPMAQVAREAKVPLQTAYARLYAARAQLQVQLAD